MTYNISDYTEVLITSIDFAIRECTYQGRREDIFSLLVLFTINIIKTVQIALFPSCAFKY